MKVLDYRWFCILDIHYYYIFRVQTPLESIYKTLLEDMYFIDTACIGSLVQILIIGIFLWSSSMNEIIDKYTTHSKNLGKTDKQPSIDLNVCKAISVFCSS